MKLAGLAWLAIVLIAGVALALRFYHGVEFRTDILALFPQQERDPALQRVNAQVTALLGKRVLLLVGDADRNKARTAGDTLSRALASSGLVATVDYRVSGDSLRDLGRTLFRYRAGLLAPEDRALLEQNRGKTIVARALATLYGPAAITDRTLLRDDPFFLFQHYLLQLPVPLPLVHSDDGVLSVERNGETYVLLSAQLAGDAYAFDFEDRFVTMLAAAERRLQKRTPSLRFLHFGAVFYAHAGAASVRRETNAIALLSALGTVALILVVFRALRPLLLGATAIGVGVLFAFAGTLWIFGTLHVIVLLLGTSLIGIATDYCLQYLATRFDTAIEAPRERLRRVLPGISLGLATTLIGYVTLVLAPFPGLREVAVFSAIGLLGAFVTLLLWFPLLDQRAPLRHGDRMLALASGLWRFWAEPRLRWAQFAVGGLCLAGAVAGMTRLKIVDDVHAFQALSPPLHRQELEIRRLTGMHQGTQFAVIRAASEESALEREEALVAALQAAERDGEIAGVQAIAQIVPSAARQRENRALVRDRLTTPYLAAYDAQLGLPPAPAATANGLPVLTLAAIPKDSPLAYLRNFVLSGEAGETIHLVLLDQVRDPAAIQRIVAGLPGVQLVDPAADITRLLGEYRTRAVVLLGISAVLMLPVLVWRYGPAASARVFLPPVAAVVLTPPLAALLGVPFTFFGAMALILVLSIGFDYTVFCRESEDSPRSTTMLGIWLAMITTILSFGLLAFSTTFAVHAFGTTLLIGTSLAFVFSPLAGRARGPRPGAGAGGAR
jgi:predicted exporter